MIPVFKPSYGQEEVNAVARVLESGWTGLGPEVAKFEEEFAHYIGVEYAVATNSGTAALHLAVEGLPATDTRELVITTPLTFVSTNHAILLGGKKPYFCDVEPDTLNLDPDSIPEHALVNACAIMCVHFGGHSCDMYKLRNLADKYDLKIIEDAAHACGGKYYWEMLGSMGDVGCFSFHAVKNLSCGSGGMLTTNHKTVYERARSLRWVGIDKSTWDRSDGTYAWEYDVTELGYNYYMNDISAAIGRIQLEKLEDANLTRGALADRYTHAFDTSSYEHDSWFPATPVTHHYATSAWHNYVIKVPARDALHLMLKDLMIGSSVHYKPNTLYSTYSAHQEPCPVAMDAWSKILTLPLYPGLSLEDQDLIINAVLDHTETCRA